jgi:hypothetical protein
MRCILGAQSPILSGSVVVRTISPELFGVLGVGAVAGRTFTEERDSSAAESTRSRIAIINGGPLFEDNVMSFAAANHSRVKDKAKYGATPVFEIAK